MKSIKQHFQELPEPYRGLALANMWWEDQDKQEQLASNALRQGFNWSKSPEGTAYWRDLCLQLADQELKNT